MWQVRKETLVVAGFIPDSAAKASGLECGDVLKEVEGVDVINEQVNFQVIPKQPCFVVLHTLDFFLSASLHCRLCLNTCRPQLFTVSPEPSPGAEVRSL
jgi:hypothetical protein